MKFLTFYFFVLGLVYLATRFEVLGLVLAGLASFCCAALVFYSLYRHLKSNRYI